MLRSIVPPFVPATQLTLLPLLPLLPLVTLFLPCSPFLSLLPLVHPVPLAEYYNADSTTSKLLFLLIRSL